PLPTEVAAERIIQSRPDLDDLDDDDLDDDDNPDSSGDAPAIVAEQDTSLRTMTVSMAVMQLELGDSPALMFRNAAHGRLNMVFRRPDGNVGWVDPAKDG